MLIPTPQVPEWLNTPLIEQEGLPTASDAMPAPDCTSWPVDAGEPPFTVGGVYTFPDRQGHTRTAHIVTEQHAMVDGCKWHVSELPEDAQLIASFTPDAETVADVRRFVLEVLNSQRWS